MYSGRVLRILRKSIAPHHLTIFAMSDDIQDLIKGYRAAMRSNVRIRMLTIALVVAIMSAHILWLFDRIKDFHHLGTTEVVASLRQESGLVDPAISSQAAQMFSELIPVYMDAVDASFAQHQPELKERAKTELAELEAHAQTRFPEIQQALSALVVDQEAVVRRAVTNVLSEAETEAFVSQYREAMLARLQAVLSADLKVHQDQASEMGVKIESTSKTRAEAAPEAMDSRELMGIMLELSGRNIRQPL